MKTCEKFQKSRSPKIENVDEMLNFLQKVAEVIYQPGTQSQYPKALMSTAVWLPITDKKQEGKWLDFYDDKQIDLLQGRTGMTGAYQNM